MGAMREWGEAAVLQAGKDDTWPYCMGAVWEWGEACVLQVGKHGAWALRWRRERVPHVRVHAAHGLGGEAVR
eukprot:362414-Chlamydomonas_euryale.AAC.4